MIRCDFGCGSTSARTRSATACWLSGSSVRATRRASTSSATSRSASSRRAASLSAAEEVVERDLGALLRIDLAGAQAFLELLGGEVDEHDLVRLVEDPVGERLADADLGQLEDRVVEAFEMLDVDRRDRRRCRPRAPRRCPASASRCASRRVRVRELVDQRELGPARDHGVDVHLLELERPVLRRAGAARPRALRRARSSRGGRAARDSRSTTSRPLSCACRPSRSIRYVLPTPAAIPSRIR